MAAVAEERKIIGYLPNDVPPIGQTIVLGFQHVLTMFPATVLVALLVGFDVGAVLTISGLATITALVLSKLIAGKYIPLYYGSSFSYIAATMSVTGASAETFGQYLGAEAVSLAQVGIVATGLVNILVGLGIRWIGKESLDKILPPVITGSVATVIGIALAFAALDMASNHWGVAFLTLLITVLISVYLQGKGFIGLLPVLFGAIAGYLISIPFGLVDFSPVMEAAWFRIPRFTLPAFTDPRAWSAVGTIAVIAIATIPESTAHLYQISLYVDELAVRMGRERYHLAELIGLNLVLDGLGDFINGMFGGVAGTNYGENNSLMVITRNYSGPSLIAAGVIAILLGFVGKLAALVGTIPVAVTGGLAIYLFGVIGMQGVALMLAEKVNLYDPKQLAIGAAIMVIGIGGHIGYGGNIPIPILTGLFPDGLPAIATAAVVGIILNAIFLIFKAPEVPTVIESSEGK
ncbi:MAG TPA: xanthine permease [Thermoflexia bacterium]|jgi:uracil permease|nr:xanthine permease [Thermoflexia bacterium]